MYDLNELKDYSDVARKLFNYMNGKINKMNICTFRVELYDFKNAYANINYPNDIYVNIGVIMDSYTSVWVPLMSKRDYVCTLLAWAIAHELFHADQLISMVTYNHSDDYKLKVEGDVQRESHDWVFANREELSAIGNFDCKIKFIKSEILPQVSDYRRASPKEYYLQTIANIILRDLDLFRQLSVFYNDQDIDVMLVVFNKTDSVEIKKDGKYSESNIRKFSELVYKYAGQYSTYHVSIATQQYKNRSCVIDITITDQVIEFMKFK